MKVSNLLQSARHLRAQEFRRGWGDVMVEKMKLHWEVEYEQDLKLDFGLEIIPDFGLDFGLDLDRVLVCTMP